MQMSTHLESPEDVKLYQNTFDGGRPVQSINRERSPHPYHRRALWSTGSHHDGTDLSSILPTPSSSTSERAGLTYGGSRHGNASPKSSESGTEADDESTGFLKGLPAPPARPRKGLRDARGPGLDGAASPLMTPSLLNTESKTLVAYRQKRLGSASPQETDEERRKIKEKFTKRKRAELIRRTFETFILCAVGLIACYRREAATVASRWGREFVVYTATIGVLFVLYPARLMGYVDHSRFFRNSQSRYSVCIPASFDPAPLLYPPFLPVLIAICLGSLGSDTVLLNIILSISSLPDQLIPFNDQSRSVHWLLATLPLIISETSFSKFHPSEPFPLKIRPHTAIDAETLSILCPLHLALVPTLGFLTTSSLLPAELQLLSVGLLNLMFASSAPQALILKTLLWMGGLGLFVFCKSALQWEVALARVPSWRFRRPDHPRPHRNVFIEALDDSLGRRLTKSGVLDDKLHDSSDEDVSARKPSMANGRTGLKLNTSQLAGAKPLSAATPQSAVERRSLELVSSPKVEDAGHSIHQRRHTLSSIGHLPPNAQTRTTPSGRPKRLWSSDTRTYLSYTAAQAQVRKWLYAGYVYAIVVVMIVFPIRNYIGKHALDGMEPFGWALGYLFGDLVIFRDWTSQFGLTQWISLPAWKQTPVLDGQDDVSTIERVRLSLGEANTRLLIVGHCLLVLAIGMTIVLQLSTVAEVDTRRKVFHGMMVAMFLPTIFVDPAFCALALSLILAIFLLLDLFRASQLPPVSRPLTYFLAPYVDGRDHRGPVVVSHMFLLIGCAIPLWLSLAGAPRTGSRPWRGWEVPVVDISMVTGVVCVGMGDAAASLIGRRYGRRKWLWMGGKSLEGSLAFAVAVVAGLVMAKGLLVTGGWDADVNWQKMVGKSAVAATGASLTEAVLTGGNDNVIVPIILWLLVRGLEI